METDLTGIQEITGGKDGSEPAGNIYLSMETGMLIMTCSFIRELYQQSRVHSFLLKGYHMMLLNIH
jgi:hypothetical protein